MELDKSNVNNVYEVKQLDVGDVVYTDNNDNILCIIERKTINDYVQSVTDGRLKNQLLRIKSMNISKVIILIEGTVSLDTKTIGITNDALHSSLVNKIIKDDVYLLMSVDVVHTFYLINKVYNSLLNEAYVPTNNLNYMQTVKCKKKENMTPQNCYIMQLSQIPGISCEIAKLIAQKYPSFKALYQGVTSKTSLTNIDKIGKVLAARVYEYLNYESMNP
jgi:ERCC4-type nuclease